MPFIELKKNGKIALILTNHILGLEKLANGNCNIILTSGEIVKDVETYDFIKQLIRESK